MQLQFPGLFPGNDSDPNAPPPFSLPPPDSGGGSGGPPQFFPGRGTPPPDAMRPPPGAPPQLPKGDNGGNETTLSHVLEMFGIIPDATIADVMDIGGPLLCYEYV